MMKVELTEVILPTSNLHPSWALFKLEIWELMSPEADPVEFRELR